jgi:hypothetical protein
MDGQKNTKRSAGNNAGKQFELLPFTRHPMGLGIWQGSPVKWTGGKSIDWGKRKRGWKKSQKL